MLLLANYIVNITWFRKFTNEKGYRLDSETINIIDLKRLIFLLVTWFQFDGIIWICKTIDFATVADHVDCGNNDHLNRRFPLIFLLLDVNCSYYSHTLTAVTIVTHFLKIFYMCMNQY